MWLNVEHVTRFAYDGPITEAYTECRLKPAHRDGQRCSSFSLTTDPRGVSVSEYADRFGTIVHHFDVLEPHEKLTVSVRSEVWTPERFEPDVPQPTQLERWDASQPTRYVPLDKAITKLAKSIGRQDDVEATATAIVAAVREAMTYETGSTNVHTTAAEALKDGRGVCQDFAHVTIGVCRALEIPARYVSGYLFDPQRDGNESESHAWVDVLDDERGWLSIDPTHALPQGDHHVRVGAGRDYADVPPSRGIYNGSAIEELEVTVHISGASGAGGQPGL
jgi:transglutaminase-like putative cysteine protease